MPNLQVPGTLMGNKNGTPVDEIVALFAGNAAAIPFGTVTPEEAYDPTAVILTYRNFGEIAINGLDLSLAYFPNEAWSLTGNYSYVDKTFFEDVDGIADIALNAPGTKLRSARPMHSTNRNWFWEGSFAMWDLFARTREYMPGRSRLMRL